MAAASQQTADAKPAMSPLSALERVNRDVRVLILQCLDGRQKLTAVCQLSRSFRPLSALAFPYDSIAALLPGVVQVFHAGRAAAGQLSYLSLSVNRPEQPGRSTLFTCPRSLRSLPCLSTLELVNIIVDLPDNIEAAASLRCILRSVLWLPSLTALWIDAVRSAHRDEPVPELDWTDNALPSPVSLRHLTLSRVLLSAASVRRVCCLPLESLLMDWSTVQAGDDAAPVSAAQPSACTLKQLEAGWPAKT